MLVYLCSVIFNEAQPLSLALIHNSMLHFSDCYVKTPSHLRWDYAQQIGLLCAIFITPYRRAFMFCFQLVRYCELSPGAQLEL